MNIVRVSEHSVVDQKTLELDLEEKGIRRVRTPAGVRRFKKPIGSIIVAGGVLQNLSTVAPDFPGWEKMKGNDGKHYYIGKFEGEKGYVVTDANDKVLAEGTSAEKLLKDFDKKVGSKGGGPKKPSTRTKYNGLNNRAKKKIFRDVYDMDFSDDEAEQKHELLDKLNDSHINSEDTEAYLGQRNDVRWAIADVVRKQKGDEIDMGAAMLKGMENYLNNVERRSYNKLSDKEKRKYLIARAYGRMSHQEALENAKGKSAKKSLHSLAQNFDQARMYAQFDRAVEAKDMQTASVVGRRIVQDAKANGAHNAVIGTVEEVLSGGE